MATSLTDVQSRTVELSAEAFDAFCHDISGMFNVAMECKQQQNTVETAKSLSERFKRIIAVNSVKAEGALDGAFQLIFDQEGLFILSGIILMLPKTNTLQNIKRGTITDIDGMTDAVKEVGNLLVGSCDRVFREGLEKHGHFVQSDTFIGNPWDNPEEKIGLANDEDFLFIPCRMTIGDFPAFNCGVIFPEAVFDKTEAEDKIRAEVRARLQAEIEEKARREAEEKAKAQAEEKPKLEAEMKAAIEAEERAKIEAQMKAEAEAEAKAQSDKKAKAEMKAKAQAEKETKAQAEKETKAQAEIEARAQTDKKAEADEETDTKTDDADTEPVEETEPAAGAVSETIQKMVQSPAGLPGESSSISLATCAKDIMQKEVLWGNADDSVQQALTKMQQTDAGYMMVGAEGLIEGIVAKSDIAATLSVYLKPMFAKWRRPIDDATLQIKIKWMMTRPVYTIKPDTSLAAIMENMRQTGVRCLPVVEPQGKVAGLVTVFDIFKALLNTDSDTSTTGKTPQAPSLL